MKRTKKNNDSIPKLINRKRKRKSNIQKRKKKNEKHVETERSSDMKHLR